LGRIIGKKPLRFIALLEDIPAVSEYYLLSYED